MKRKKQCRINSIIVSLSVLAISFLAGCDKPDISFGTTFVTNNNTTIVRIDTFGVNLSTVVLDSFPTAGTGVMLIGSYNDPYLGSITSKSFLQIGIPASIPTITNLSVFDSVSLIMRINKTFYGDTSLSQRYYVSQLNSILQVPLPPNIRTFFNNSIIDYNPSPLGFADVTIKPTALITRSILSKDTVEIRLPDTLGQDLLHQLYVKSDVVRNLTSFVNYFKGLCIYTDNNSGAIFGFNDSCFIRLVYHQPGAVFQFVNVSFPMTNASLQFNQVSIDRTGTPLAAVSSQPRPNPTVPAEVQSTLTGKAAYVQSMSGVQAKVRFPSVLNLGQLSDYVSILKAVLVLRPLPGTYSPKLALPPKLSASATDQNNQVGGSLTYNGAVQTGNLVTDYITGQNTEYSYDVTAYVKQLLTLTPNNQDGLMITIPSPANYTGFNRAVLGDKANGGYGVQLQLYYISLPH